MPGSLSPCCLCAPTCKIGWLPGLFQLSPASRQSLSFHSTKAWEKPFALCLRWALKAVWRGEAPVKATLCFAYSRHGAALPGRLGVIQGRDLASSPSHRRPPCLLPLNWDEIKACVRGVCSCWHHRIQQACSAWALIVSRSAPRCSVSLPRERRSLPWKAFT